MVLGANVLQKYYVYFDNRDNWNRKIGIALKNPGYIPPLQRRNGREFKMETNQFLFVISSVLCMSAFLYKICKLYRREKGIFEVKAKYDEAKKPFPKLRTFSEEEEKEESIN